MVTRRSVVLVSLLFLLSFDLYAAGRHRAVRMPTLGCSYALMPSPGLAAEVASAGASAVAIGVMQANGWQAGCAGWSAYSLTPWITLESDSDATVYLNIAPNSSNVQRSGTVVIAAIPMLIVQGGTPNLIVNGGFDTSVDGWGWNDFPNSRGSKAWSPLDAAGNPASGSLLMRDTKTGDQAFQQMQCVDLQPGVYDYGFTVRSQLPDLMQPAIAFVPFTGKACTGTYASTYPSSSPKVDQAGVWESHTYIAKLTSSYQSVMIVLGAYARAGANPPEVWIDDVFLRPNE